MRVFTSLTLSLCVSLFFPYGTIKAQCQGVFHDNHVLSSWLSCIPAESPHPNLDAGHWIMLDLGQVYALDTLTIYNYNVENETESGFDSVRIDVAQTLNNWQYVADYSLSEAPGMNNYIGEQLTGFNGIFTRYILVTALTNHSGSCFGLSEIIIGVGPTASCIAYDILTNSSDPTCPGADNGQIEVFPIGANGMTTYQWSGGQTTSSIEGLSPGLYSVTITDQAGCQESTSIQLNEPVTDTTVYDAIPVPDGHYFDMDEIISGGIVAYNGQVAYGTSNSINLSDNFEVVNGGIFTANIEDCIANFRTNFNSFSSSGLPPYIDFLGGGQVKGIQLTTSDESGDQLAKYVIGGQGLIPDDLGVARFLAHTTLGANLEMINQAAAMGVHDWLDWQFTIPHQDFMTAFDTVLTDVYEDPGNGLIGFQYFRMAWWQNMLTGEDYLRDRIAFHLSQLFVVSDKSDLMNLGEGLASYYDMLHDNAFSNFRDILYDVTFHPTMGVYLSHINNPKSDTSLNQYPDENYAREVMQLFTIGLLELELNGFTKKNIYGQDIPTYGNDEVIEFSKIFTGLGFDAPMAEFGSRRFYDMTVPMIMYEDFHEPGPKYLLYGDTIPDGQTGLDDIDDAIENLFYHPNVGPFFCRRMIQYLVTSNPSPEYLLRVVQVFEDNGLGVRGDMKAIIRAIITDPEAISCEYLMNPGYGKLVEPLLRYTQFLRTFDVSSSDSTFYSTGFLFQELTFQAPLGAPSVFNFFSPNYVPSGLPPGPPLKGPEFQILNSYTSLGYYNLLNSLKENNQVLQHETATIQVDLSDELALASTPELLLDRLDLLFTHGTLSQETRDVIIEAMNLLGTDEMKLEMALYLLLTSPDYVVGI